MNTLLRVSFLLLATAGLAPFVAQAADGRAPEEVIVEAPQSLRKLRLAVNRAEKRMFEVFNEVNDDDRFDIHCKNEKMYGSKMRQQVCQPTYRAEANEAEAKQFLKASNPEVAGVQTGIQGVTSIEHYNGLMNEKIRAAPANNAEFRTALDEYNALSAIYQERLSGD